MATFQVLLRNSPGRAEENHEDISHANLSAAHYLRSVSPEYETGTLTTEPLHSVSLLRIVSASVMCMIICNVVMFWFGLVHLFDPGAKVPCRKHFTHPHSLVHVCPLSSTSSSMSTLDGF